MNPRKQREGEEKAEVYGPLTKPKAKALAIRMKVGALKKELSQAKKDLKVQARLVARVVGEKTAAEVIGKDAKALSKRVSSALRKKVAKRALSEKQIQAQEAARLLRAYRKSIISDDVRKADADCRTEFKKHAVVKIVCPPSKRKEVLAAARKAAKEKKSVPAEWKASYEAKREKAKSKKAKSNRSMMHHRKARHNGLRRAHRNGLLGDARSYAMSIAPWIVGGISGYALHEAAAMAGEKALGVPLTAKIEGALVKIPAVGKYAASLSNTLQGAAVAVLLGYVAKKVGGKASPYIKDAGISALVIGVVKDASRYKDAGWSVPALGDLAFGDLAFGDLAFGDLAFGDVSALGGISALSGVSALGDGMAYETAPLSADYSQASLGDAYYCGADFSSDEGQCMINGRGHYMHRYGAPPHRMQHNPKGSSHLAGREGHRWGWLVKMVGWQKAAQIAAMAPESRVKVLQKLRAAALQAFQQEMRVYEAAQIAREIPEQLSDLVPSAGAPMGAQGAAEAPLGDSALFMGA
jgi:hypothetical protein